MWIIVVMLIVLGVLIALLKTYSKGASGTKADSAGACGGECSTCASVGEDCRQDRVLDANKMEPEYFDDEELDIFKGRDAAGYTTAEVDMFAEVMRTMRPDEVGDWLVSLEHRGVNLPERLREEANGLVAGIHSSPRGQ